MVAWPEIVAVVVAVETVTSVGAFTNAVCVVSCSEIVAVVATNSVGPGITSVSIVSCPETVDVVTTVSTEVDMMISGEPGTTLVSTATSVTVAGTADVVCTIVSIIVTAAPSPAPLVAEPPFTPTTEYEALGTSGPGLMR